MNGEAGARLPGGTSISFLDVYEDVAPDGLAGGSPHVHLASTECYVVIGGEGRLQTLAASGPSETELRAGTVVWFTPGTVHRAVNDGGLRVVVLMSNAGLPEAGDAVMTFPTDVMTDAEEYRRAAVLPVRSTEPDRAADARARRDLAVTGFLALREAASAGDPAPLDAFYESAARIVAEHAPDWADIVRDGPLAQASATLADLAALRASDRSHLDSAALSLNRPSTDERGFGMCGRLRPVSG